MNILKCSELCVAYDGDVVVQNATFEIDEGDYVVVVGENGSGKSTLIKTILGLISPVLGDLCFCGGLRQNEIGYLAQQSDIKSDFPASVFEVVLSGFCGKKSFLPFYTKKQKQIAHENLKKLDMDDFCRRPISQLSGGQLRRALLARALCATKKMILCDEPTAGLDALGASQLYDSIKKLNDEGISVLMVTHDLQKALMHANKVIHMGRDNVYFMHANEYAQSELAQRLLGTNN